MNDSNIDSEYEDFLSKKENIVLKSEEDQKNKPDLIPITSGVYKIKAPQLLISNFINDNSYGINNILIKWGTGSGKTLLAINTAKTFIDNKLIMNETPIVKIVSFTEKIFLKEFIKFPELGFITISEKIELERLRRLSENRRHETLSVYNSYKQDILRRVNNPRYGGYYNFEGYQSFSTNVFTNISESNRDLLDNLYENIDNGSIEVNNQLIDSMKNALLICDEIHNTYNSKEKNSWGKALQYVMDRNVGTMKVILLSATPLNNKPAEIVTLANFLNPSKFIKERDYFDSNGNLLNQESLDKLVEFFKLKVSYLEDTNIKYFPKKVYKGEIVKLKVPMRIPSAYGIIEEINEIPLLNFIKCPMSKLHFQTYLSLCKENISSDGKTLFDMVFPNSQFTNEELTETNPKKCLKVIGNYKTSKTRNNINAMSQDVKNEYGIDINIDEKTFNISGDFLNLKNLKIYSNKYYTGACLIKSILKNSPLDKIMIYHHYVKMSGILTLEEIVKNLGFIGENNNASANTRCSICFNKLKHHKYEEDDNDKDEDKENNSNYEGDDSNQKLGLTSDNKNDNIEDNNGNNEDCEECKFGGGFNFSIVPKSKSKSRSQSLSNDFPKKIMSDYSDDKMMRNAYTNSNFSIEIPNKVLVKHDKYSIYEIEKDKRYVARSIITNKSGSKIKEITLIYNTKKTIAVERKKYTKDVLTFHSVDEFSTNLLTENSDTFESQNSLENFEYHSLFTNEEKFSSLLKKIESITGSGKSKIIKDHKFVPCRYIILHSNKSQEELSRGMDKYNSIDNLYGINFKLILGSKIIKESYDFKATTHLIKFSKPINIPYSVQVDGRIARNGSHSNLPIESRVANIYNLVSTIPDDCDNYYLEDPVENYNKGIEFTKTIFGESKTIDLLISKEEQFYCEKLITYKQIRKLESYLHKIAIDSYINYDKDYIESFDENKGIGPIKYSPMYYPNEKLIDKGKFIATKLDLVSFITNKHYKNEINEIIIIIKKLFKKYYFFKYEQLWNIIVEGKMEYKSEFNTRLFNEGNFIIALNTLLLKDYKSKLYNLYDPSQTYITRKGKKYKISEIGEYLILTEINNYGIPFIDINSFISLSTDEKTVIDLLKNSTSNFEIELNEVYKLYENVDYNNEPEELFDILERSTEFHYQLMDQLILHDKGKSNILESGSKLTKHLKEFYIDIKVLIKEGETLSGYYKENFIRKYSRGNWEEASYVKTYLPEAPVVGYYTNRDFKVRIAYTEKDVNLDLRSVIKGIVCNTKQKSDTLYLLNLLGVKVKANKKEGLCNILRNQLVKKEISNKKLKYFYLFNESPLTVTDYKIKILGIS